jgi:hypothetical protein
VTDLGKDVRYAARTLRQSPGFAATALLTIALATGAVTAMFTLVNGVPLRALPYAEPDRLVRLYSADPSEPTERSPLSLPDLSDWRARTDVFSGVAGYRILTQVLLGRGDPQELHAAYVTGSFFGVLGARVVLGRLLDENDARRADRNVVISSRLWRSAFGGDAAVIGTAVSLQGAPFTIVGVADPELRFPAPDISLWLPQSVLSERAIGPRSRENSHGSRCRSCWP